MARNKNVMIREFLEKKRGKMCGVEHPKRPGILCTRDPDHKSLGRPGAATHYNIEERVTWKSTGTRG